MDDPAGAPQLALVMRPMVQLDSTNLRLLEMLQSDARTSIIDLARSVERAESTVRERIASMERDGVLKGYKALVDPEKLGFRARALIRADCDRRRLPDVTRRLAAVPHVVSVTLSTGAKPLLVELLAESPARLEHILEERIAPLELDGVEVELVLRSLVEPRALPAAIPAGGLAPSLPSPLPDLEGLRPLGSRGGGVEAQRRPAGLPGALH
jgi:DNA-binding Lrp family transcriptional regulator